MAWSEPGHDGDGRWRSKSHGVMAGFMPAYRTSFFFFFFFFFWGGFISGRPVKESHLLIRVYVPPPGGYIPAVSGCELVDRLGRGG